MGQAKNGPDLQLAIGPQIDCSVYGSCWATIFFCGRLYHYNRPIRATIQEVYQASKLWRTIASLWPLAINRITTNVCAASNSIYNISNLQTSFESTTCSGRQQGFLAAARVPLKWPKSGGATSHVSTGPRQAPPVAMSAQVLLDNHPSAIPRILVKFHDFRVFR